MNRIFSFALPVVFSCSLQAQKIPLDHSVYADWKKLDHPCISDNGKWASYEINPQKGDGCLFIVNLENLSKDSVPRGHSAEFSPGSEYIAFKIKPEFLKTRQAKVEKKKEKEMPGDSLGIWLLETGILKKYPSVEEFQVPRDSSSWMAFRYYESAQSGNREQDTTGNDTPGEEGGSVLVICNPVSGREREIPGVTGYQISRNGKAVAMLASVGDTVARFRASHFNTVTGDLHHVLEDEGFAMGVVLDDRGEQMAFIHDVDSGTVSGYSLYYWKSGLEKARCAVDSATRGMPGGWGVSKNGNVYFSGDGTRLFFGTAETEKEEPDDSLPGEEKFSLDVWNWKDGLLQPMQKVNLEKEKKRACLAVTYVGSDRMIQLEDDTVRRTEMAHRGNGDNVLGLVYEPYNKLMSWEFMRYCDAYLMNMKTGDNDLLMRKKHADFLEMSPEGRYVFWYETTDSNYYAHDIRENRLISLTHDIPVPLYDELNDRPHDPLPYGRAGFSREDREVYIYDRFDVWKLDMEGIKTPVNLTAGHGRANSISYRYEQTEPEQYYIDAKDPMLLHGMDETTKKTGYYHASAIIRSKPAELISGPFWYSSVKKAKENNRLIWKRESFREYPDLWMSDLTFDYPLRISCTNPQSERYLWGRPGLVHWISPDKQELDGILYLPEDLDTEKKYPMLVYFYERSSPEIYRHRIPAPSRSTINIPFCVSNGYVVFVPDIPYRIGYPGQSAYDAVVSGILAMLDDHDFIDRGRIALQGQSWGGYQVAYLITRTDMFACAMAGAPVSNMTSAYGGIRWGSGMSRMFQYEETQSRIGGTLWEKPLLYIENSPVFHVPRINTPVLIMHNDQDGAVPWYQGIEFFVALRRLGKPAWMLVYNREEHNLRKWPNRVDLSIRMMQFFDHYLKEAPAPLWMKEGIPATDKGTEKGYELMDR